MPRHDVRAYLFDIAEACRLITEFTSGKTLDDYRRDAMVRSAVERQFKIIGEALRQLTSAIQNFPHASPVLPGSLHSGTGLSTDTQQFPMMLYGG